MLSAAINGKGSNGEQARWNPATGQNLDGTEGKVSFFVKKEVSLTAKVCGLGPSALSKPTIEFRSSPALLGPILRGLRG